MTPTQLAQALREAQQRAPEPSASDSELIRGFNTCVDCGAPILNPGCVGRGCGPGRNSGGILRVVRREPEKLTKKNTGTIGTGSLMPTAGSLLVRFRFASSISIDTMSELAAEEADSAQIVAVREQVEEFFRTLRLGS
jgi:hypothetical protein